jgi:hypothetical protein
MAAEFIDRQTDVFCDLAQQDRRYVAALVKGRCRTLALTFHKLLVRTTLPTSEKPSATRIATTSLG